MYFDITLKNIDMDDINNILHIKELQNEYPFVLFSTVSTENGCVLRVSGNIDTEEYSKLIEILKSL